MRIIPAIDIIDGKCIRLEKGNYMKKTIYSNSPLDMAKKFEDQGIRFLHLVDLDGAKSKSIRNYKVLESISKETNLVIDFGGGIKSDEAAQMAFDFGASQITGGSIAVSDPEKMKSWIAKYGVDKIILGADLKSGKIAINGWVKESNQSLDPFIEHYVQNGIEYIICTDIQKDGMLSGPAFELYANMLKKQPQVKLIASGGISSLDDLLKLRDLGLEGAIVGKAIYENKIRLSDLKQFT